MFEKSIIKNNTYTYPITIGTLNKDKNIECIVATMININKDGYFLTCKHVTEEIKNYFNFQNNQEKNKSSIIDMNLILPFPLKKDTKIDIIEHNKLDLAIIHFEELKTNHKEYPIFSKNIPAPGKFICKLGYAFSNQNPFQIKDNHLSIINQNFEYPIFPYEGMITRLVNMNIDNCLYEKVAFETSTAGLKGQSGGPIFDTEGIIYGIQSMNVTMPLDTIGVVKNNEETMLYPQFINFGLGITSQEIIKLLDDNNIKYQSK